MGKLRQLLVPQAGALGRGEHREHRFAALAGQHQRRDALIPGAVFADGLVQQHERRRGQQAIEELRCGQRPVLGLQQAHLEVVEGLQL
ncbi:hypothetical protein G6F62_015519 [Rhizopus arrhizus]|nr:hypothetical protein G6F62_015519 [Rhizopus arrhizus]